MVIHFVKYLQTMTKQIVRSIVLVYTMTSTFNLSVQIEFMIIMHSKCNNL